MYDSSIVIPAEQLELPKRSVNFLKKKEKQKDAQTDRKMRIKYIQQLGHKKGKTTPMQPDTRKSTKSNQCVQIQNKGTKTTPLPKDLATNYLTKNEEYLWKRIKHQLIQAVSRYCASQGITRKDDVQDFMYLFLKDLIQWLKSAKTGESVQKQKNGEPGERYGKIGKLEKRHQYQKKDSQQKKYIISKEAQTCRQEVKQMRKMVKAKKDQVKLKEEKLKKLEQALVCYQNRLTTANIQIHQLNIQKNNKSQQSQQTNKIQKQCLIKLFANISKKFDNSMLTQIINFLSNQLALSKSKQQRWMTVTSQLLTNTQAMHIKSVELSNQLQVKNQECAILRNIIGELGRRIMRSQGLREKQIVRREKYVIEALLHEVRDQEHQQQIVIIRMQEQNQIIKQETATLREQLKQISVCLEEINTKYSKAQLQLQELSQINNQMDSLCQSFEKQMTKMHQSLEAQHKKLQADQLIIKASVANHKQLYALVTNYGNFSKIGSKSTEELIAMMSNIMIKFSRTIENLQQQIKYMYKQVEKHDSRFLSISPITHKPLTQRSHQESTTQQKDLGQTQTNPLQLTAHSKIEIIQVHQSTSTENIQQLFNQHQISQTDTSITANVSSQTQDPAFDEKYVHQWVQTEEEEGSSQSDSDYTFECDRGTQYETTFSISTSKQVQTSPPVFNSNSSQTQEISSQDNKLIQQVQKQRKEVEELKQSLKLITQQLNILKKSESVALKLLENTRIQHANTKYQLEELRHHNSTLAALSEDKNSSSQVLRELQTSISELREQNTSLKQHNLELLDTIEYANSLFNSTNSHQQKWNSHREDRKMLGSESTSSHFLEVQSSQYSDKSQEQALLSNKPAQPSPEQIPSILSYSSAISRLLADFVSQQSSEQSKLSALSTLIELLSPESQQLLTLETFLKNKRLRLKSVEKLEKNGEFEVDMKEKLFKFFTSN